MHAVALPFQPDDLGVMQKAVQDGTRRGVISQHLSPILQGTIGSDDDGALLVAADIIAIIAVGSDIESNRKTLALGACLSK